MSLSMSVMKFGAGCFDRCGYQAVVGARLAVGAKGARRAWVRQAGGLVLFGFALSVCAHVAPPLVVAPVAQRAAVDDQRARQYLTALTLKKNRFLAANGYDATYTPFRAVTSSTVAFSIAPCAQIEHSQWAASVDSGTFDVFTPTMERCYGGNEQS